MFNIQRPINPNDIAYQELEMISSISENAIDRFEREVNYAHDLFWKGKTSPTIKARLAGTNLQTMFENAAAAQALIKLVKPLYEERGVPEGWNVEWNGDGSGKITKIL